MRPRAALALILSAIILLVASFSAAQEHKGGELLPPEVGIEEKLGEFPPYDLGFLDSKGDSVYLRQLIGKPTILTLVYYHCPTICMPLLEGVADVVTKTDLDPGKDYNIVTGEF